VRTSAEQDEIEGPRATRADARPWDAVHPDWGILAWAAALAALAVLVVFVSVAGEIERLNRIPGTIRLTTRLPGARTVWSFNDSWVANLAVVMTALVVLVASTDALTPLLGAERTAAFRLVILASVIAVILAVVAQLLLKLFGSELEVATVAGTLAAGALVLTATLFQLITIVIQATRLTDDHWAQFGILAGGILVALLVALYADRSLRTLLRPLGPRRAALL
jgi:hypothetical protein